MAGVAHDVLRHADLEGEALFLARARAVDPTFASSPEVRELCVRLDELPLAIELAAARTALFSPTQILERLSQRLDLLKGDRDADPRQRSLRATIEWSHELLTADEQTLFRRLSVFAGGCTYEAAERVADGDPDRLQSLLDKSLLRRRDTDFGPRYWMLETIREFAAERLATSGEAESIREHHLDFELDVAAEAEPQLTGPLQQRWFKRLALEQENVREALGFACDRGDGNRALMLAGTIWRFWWTRGQIDEASRWYERAFSVSDGASELARARGLFGAAHMTEARGDIALARAQFEQAAEQLRRLGETRWLILALAHLAGTFAADPERARGIYDEALALANATGDIRGAAIVKGNLSDRLLAEGDETRATALREEALEGHRALGDVYGTATSLAGLAELAHRRGDFDLAANRVGESLELSSSIEDTLTLSSTLALAAALLLASGDPDRAARLCAATSALVDRHGFDPDPRLRETRQAAESALGDRFDSAWAGGTELDLAEAVELAVAALDAISGRLRVG